MRHLNPRLLVVLGLLLLLGGWASFSCAAENPNVARIGIGDVLRIEVGARTDLSGSYVVSTEGSISMPVIGAIRASGRTPGELADDLSRRFSLVDRDIPRVTVAVAQSASRKILVLGAVVVPGSYNFTEMPTVWEAIAQAGGATEDALLSAVEVISSEAAPGLGTKRVDVASAIQSGKLDQLERLRPGDTVRVPRAGASASGRTGVVYVFGAVGAQGARTLDQTPDLLSAVIASGGPSADADLSAVEIVRRNGSRVQHLTVNLGHYLNRGHPEGNLPLQEGDTIYLQRVKPRGATLFSVLGIITPLIALTTSVIALSRR